MGNEFTGSVPPSISRLNKLEKLSLLDNAFTGIMPLHAATVTDVPVGFNFDDPENIATPSSSPVANPAESPVTDEVEPPSPSGSALPSEEEEGSFMQLEAFISVVTVLLFGVVVAMVLLVREKQAVSRIKARATFLDLFV